MRAQPWNFDQSRLHAKEPDEKFDSGRRKKKAAWTGGHHGRLNAGQPRAITRWVRVLRPTRSSGRRTALARLDWIGGTIPLTAAGGNQSHVASGHFGKPACVRRFFDFGFFEMGKPADKPRRCSDWDGRTEEFVPEWAGA